jgi:hypothetical protein
MLKITMSLLLAHCYRDHFQSELFYNGHIFQSISNIDKNNILMSYNDILMNLFLNKMFIECLVIYWTLHLYHEF